VTLTKHLPDLPDQRRLLGTLKGSVPSQITGTIWSVGRNAIQAVALPVPVGAICEIHRRGRASIPAEVIGFEGATTLLSPLDGADGISPGDRVMLCDTTATIRVGPELIGRVIDAAGRPIDGLGPLNAGARAPLDAAPVDAMRRPPIDRILTTGVRSIDALLTLGRGQRIGIFAGSGVGKSTLLGMMARGTDADIVVIGLVGERGREVQEYLQREASALSQLDFRVATLVKSFGRCWEAPKVLTTFATEPTRTLSCDKALGKAT
jgi:flagellum-specific ATP synthase